MTLAHRHNWKSLESLESKLYEEGLVADFQSFLET